MNNNSLKASLDQAASALFSTAIGDVTKGLNAIISKSNEVASDGSGLVIEVNPLLPTALADLLETVNPLGCLLFESTNGLAGLGSDVFLTIKSDPQFMFLARYLDDNAILLNILAILRNLSMESSNETYIAYHTIIMKHLVSILLASVAIQQSMECTQLVIETLINIAQKLDLTGGRRLQNTTGYFLDDLPRDPNGAALLKLKMTPAMSSTTSTQYIQILNAMMPALLRLVDHETSIGRVYVMRSLELLSRMMQTIDNHSFFAAIPTHYFHTLFNLLLINNTRGEDLVPEAFAITCDPYGRSRPPHAAFVASVAIGADLTLFHDQYDLELREMALDQIKALCVINSNNTPKLLDIPSCIEVLYRIVTFRTQSGISTSSQSYRVESSNKAAAILSYLAAIPEAVPKFRALRSEVLVDACNDSNVADILCIYAPFLFPPAMRTGGL